MQKAFKLPVFVGILVVFLPLMYVKLIITDYLQVSEQVSACVRECEIARARVCTSLSTPRSFLALDFSRSTSASLFWR